MTGEKAYNNLLVRYEKKLTELRNLKKKFDLFKNRTCKSCKHFESENNVWTRYMRCKCDRPSITPYGDGTIYLNVYEDFCCNQYEAKG